MRELLSKLSWRASKNDYLNRKSHSVGIIKQANEEQNDQALLTLLESKWKCFEELVTILRNKLENSNEATFSEEELLKDLKEAYAYVGKIILEKYMKLSQPVPNEYIFILEDKGSRKVKYIGVGPLNTTKINFFRIRFRNELLLNLNEQKESTLFYHPLSNGYFDFEKESLRMGISMDYEDNERTFPLNVVVKQ